MSILEKIENFLYTEYLKRLSNDTLRVEGFDEEDELKVLINSYEGKLYCIELSTHENLPHYLSSDKIDVLYKIGKEKDNSSIVWYLYKNKFYQKNYIFSHSKDILEIICDDVEGFFLDSLELVEVLRDIYLNNEFDIINKVKERRNKVLDGNFNFKNIGNEYSRMVREDASNKLLRSRVYYARDYIKDKKTDLTSFFNIDFNGAFFSYIDFSSRKVSNHLQNRIKSGIHFDVSNIKSLKEDFEKGDIDLMIMNSILILNDEGIKSKSELELTAKSLGLYLNINFQEKNMLVEKMLCKTLIHSRDTALDEIVVKDSFFYNYITTCHKADVKNPHFEATDLNKAHINVHLQKNTENKKNANKAILLVGVNGSGKTTNENNIISQIIGLNVDKETIVDKELTKTHIRDFCIKKSGYRTSLAVEKAGVKVDRLNTSLDKFRYNLLNIDFEEKDGEIYPDLNQISFNAYLISFILEANDQENENAGLNGKESTLFQETVTKIYKQKDWNAIGIYDIKKINLSLYERIKNLGYDDYDHTILDIKEENYEFLNRPTINNLMTKLESIKSLGDDTDENVATARSLFYKLRTVLTTKAFSNYDDFSIKDSKYLYIDFEGIGTENPMYVPIFIANLLRLYRVDRKKQQDLIDKNLFKPEIFYHFSEAGNVFAYSTFKRFVQKFTNESRSYNIIPFWSTQLIEQVPTYIIKQVSNVFCTFPASSKRKSLINEMSKFLTFTEEQVELLMKTKKHGLALITEGSISIVKIPMSDKQLYVFGQETSNEEEDV